MTIAADAGAQRVALATTDLTWMHWVTFAYVLVIGGFSVGAWLSATPSEPFRAAVCAGARGMSIVAALVARAAFAANMRFAGVGGILFALGFATWAAEGLAHAWQVNGAQIGEMQVIFLTAAEPCLFLLIEHVRETRETIRLEFERAEEAERLKQARERDRGRPNLRVVSKGAAAVGIAMAPAADALAAPNATQPPPRERAPIVQMADAQAVQRDKVARAQQMLSEGVNKSEISRRLGVHRNTVGNWLKAA